MSPGDRSARRALAAAEGGLHPRELYLASPQFIVEPRQSTGATPGPFPP